MKAYIKHSVDNSIFEQAKCGFIQMGFEIEYYNNIDNTFKEKLEYADVVVGFIQDISNLQKVMGLTTLKPLDYPEELKKYLHRDIKKISISELPNVYPFFIKPTSIKSFNGRVVRDFKDLIGIIDTELYFTNTIYNIVSEYRCFIANGKILGVKHYKGSPYKSLDENIVLEMLKDYKNAPKAFSMDLGLTECGKTILIECNNGYSSGNYGLSDTLYATFLLESYKELINN